MTMHAVAITTNMPQGYIETALNQRSAKIGGTMFTYTDCGMGQSMRGDVSIFSGGPSELEKVTLSLRTF